MSTNTQHEQPLNFPRFEESDVPKPRATAEEYIDLIEFVLEMTPWEQVLRQKKVEDLPTRRFSLRG